MKRFWPGLKPSLTLYKLQHKLEQRIEERTTELAQANASLKAEIIERTQAEEALRESEATARALLNAPADTIILFDAQGIILDANETATHGFSKSREELIGSCIWDLFPPDVTQRRKPYVDKVFHSGRPVRFEDERTGMWFDNVLYPVFDERQKVTRVAVIARDITERKQTQTLLEESEARLRALFENSGYAMGVSKYGVHVMANPAYLDLFGYDYATELIGKPILDLIAPEQQAQILENVQRRAKGEPVPLFYETRGLRKDGSTFDMDVKLSTYELDGEVYTVGIMRDITERKLAEAALRKSEEKYRSLFENMIDGFAYCKILLDENDHPIDFVYLEVNDALERLTGLRKQDVVGKRVTEIIPTIKDTYPELFDIYGEVALTGQETQFDLHFEPLEIWLSISAYSFQKGYFVAVFENITERKQAEEALQRHAERLRILHEIDQAILSAQSPEAIARAAASHVRQLIPCRRIGVTSFDLVANEATILALDEDTGSAIREGTRISLEPLEDVVEELRQGRVIAWGDFLSRGKALEIAHTEGIRSSVSVPLMIRGELIGALSFNYEMTEPAVFSPEQKEFTLQVADQLAIAIQQARLHEQVQHYAEELGQRVADRTRELATLYEVTAVASRPLDLQTTLAQSLEQVLGAMKSEMGTIHLLDEAGGEMAEGERLTLAAQQGFPPDLAAQIESVLVGDGLVGWVIEHDKPLFVPDITTDPRVIIQTSRLGAKVYVGVPMRTGGHMMGVLSVLRETTQPPFSKDEIALLTAIADHVGVVAESARLRQQVEQAAVLVERQRLARELHDSVTQSLYSLTLLASGWQKLVRVGKMKNLEEPLTEVGEVAQQALKEMRLLVYELRPPVLEKEGLLGALHQRLGAVEKRAGIEARLIAGEVIELPILVEEGLYRITQEALNNALKHAAATSIIIRIGVVDEQVELEVTDNGQGFDLDTIAEGGGMGLTSIQERAAQLGGEWQVISAPGEGTTVRVVVSR
ncbi:PAS domain S-box protein [Chloroflexota bacterium]